MARQVLPRLGAESPLDGEGAAGGDLLVLSGRVHDVEGGIRLASLGDGGGDEREERGGDGETHLDIRFRVCGWYKARGAKQRRVDRECKKECEWWSKE